MAEKLRKSSNQAEPSARAILAALREERPHFHAPYQQPNAVGQRDWSIRPPVLDFLADLNAPLEATLETGCGYTTILLAAQSRKHLTVAPSGSEMRLIRDWAEAHGLPMDHVEHLEGRSQDVLPGAQLPDLDLILIDGDHAFPAPFIDWYYTVDHLRPGGWLLVDDIQLRSCNLLNNFLRSETGRWEAHGRLINTSLWRRRGSQPVARGVHHRDQPFSREILSMSWAMDRTRQIARRVLKGH